MGRRGLEFVRGLFCGWGLKESRATFARSEEAIILVGIVGVDGRRRRRETKTRALGPIVFSSYKLFLVASRKKAQSRNSFPLRSR